MISKHASLCMSWEDYIDLQNKNYEPLNLFKAYIVYPRVKSFWIYTTISFFKIFSFFPTCVKIFSILKKKFINKQYIVKKIYTIYRKDPVTWTNGQNNFEATCVSFTTFKTNLEKCYIIIYYLFPRPYCCELGMTHNINCQFKKIMMIGKNYSVSLYFIFTIMMERKC